MKEILITSSVLILAILAIRQLFKGVLSRRLQYALWALVLVRLLVPVSLPAAKFSVMTAAKPVEQVVAARLDRITVLPVRPETVQTPGMPSNVSPALDPAAPEKPLPQLDKTSHPGTYDPSAADHPRPAMTAGEVMALVWKVGMTLMGGFFLVSNLAFSLKLRKNRREWRASGDMGPFPSHRVYVVPQRVIPSPCLFGNAIYITPAVAEDPARLRHVLAHEATHARHLDPVWSLLRCVCLTVYWFDPLVWVAAACSRTDCELACDESALKALGEDERIGYGRTLLSLIPVRRRTNPMLAATTMAAGKKQLHDRITRIARNPRQWVAAALVVALLSGILAACTFTGAKESPDPETLRSLTGEELRWFNHSFFNSAAVQALNSAPYASGPDGDVYYNLRNQFANPINLYEKPEDIDLYELLYLEGSAPTNEELQAVLDTTSGELPCPAYKLTTREIDDILTRYTGLTLDTANRESLTYTYDAHTDAYYWMHGDTNYCGDLEFLYGTREGNTVRLYYNDGQYCVTLADQGSDSYHFLSNQKLTERVNVPTAFPVWDPVETMSLAEATPYEAPTVTVETRPGGDQGDYQNWLEWYSTGEDSIRVYRSTLDDQTVYAALEQDNGSLRVFLTTHDPNTDTLHVSRLFDQGEDAHILALGYWESEGQPRWPTWDFYAFRDHQPILLCRSTGCGGASPQILDLDGDGTVELITQEELFFLRGGVLCRADLKELIPAACPELADRYDLVVDRYGKYLQVYGYTGDYKNVTRYIYFDGQSLLVYKDDTPTEDHMVVGADEGVPQAVVEQARDYAETVYEGKMEKTSTSVPTEDGNIYLWGDPASYDDWRIESFTGPFNYSFGGATVEGWQFNYELHTTTPEKVVLAGGKYITEDNWVSPGYPSCDAVFFHVKDGEYRYLDHQMVQWGMLNYFQEGEVLSLMEREGVELTASSTYPQLWFQKYLGQLTDHRDNIRLQYDDGQGGGDAYLVDPKSTNALYHLEKLRGRDILWGWAETPAAEPAGPSVTLSSEDWYEMLRFWRDSDLVMYKQTDRDPVWLRVLPGSGAQAVSAPYSWARSWFDKTQYEALPPIPDEGEGQSYLNIAKAWAEDYEGIMTRLAPGGSTTCTFVKVTGVGTLEDMSERWFPAGILDYPHFAFTYDVAFVPENEDAWHTLWAGNTWYYEGGDPDVPQGAYTYNRMGYMYLKDGYWYGACAGTG